MNQRDTMVRQVSRTFALSIEQLPFVLRDAVSVAYLMFRISDGIEDHPHLPADQKVHLLEQWAGVLSGREAATTLTSSVAGLDGSDPEVDVIKQTPLILDWFHELPPAYQSPVLEHVHATTLGMARWQAHGPYVEDEDALDDYMHEVAGRVGYLVTDLFALFSPRIREMKADLMPLSRECGLALQTVNVIRGIPKDFERGWVFVPQSFYERVGLTRETLLEPKNNSKALAVVGMLADKADRHLENGLRFITMFPRYEHSIRLSLIWPFLFAARTLAVSRSNPDVINSEAKITRNDIRSIVTNTRLFGWSNRWLKNYYRHASFTPSKSRETLARLEAKTVVDNQ